MSDDRSATRPLPQRPCPICGKPALPALRPFCSQRCADIDLHRWLSGTYAVAASPDDERESEPDTEQPD